MPRSTGSPAWLPSDLAIAQAGVDPADVKAIAVSSQGETTIALDEKGLPLRPALVWLDNRSAPQAQWLASQFDSRVVYETTGVPEILPTWTACKILWIRENEPEIFKRARKFLLVKDYLMYRLSGEYTTEGAIACTTLLYDIRRHQWWGEMLDAVGISADQLPAIVRPGEAVGHLSAAAAAELGLDRRTLVIPAGMDQAAGAIGAGSITPDIISETTGAAMAIQVTSPYPDMQSPVAHPAVACTTCQACTCTCRTCPPAGCLSSGSVMSSAKLKARQPLLAVRMHTICSPLWLRRLPPEATGW